MLNQKLSDVKAELFKAIKYKDDVSIAVKIYDCDESGEQTFDVEITYYINGKYEDNWVSDVFENEKDAMKRAKAVLKTVTGWFDRNDDIEVAKEIEIYHV